MGWELRTHKIRSGKKTPNYGTDSNDYTIRFHYFGQLEVIDGVTKYIGGRIAHFDWCNPDKMSMLELKNMGEEVGFKSSATFVVACGKDIDSVEKVDYLMDDREAVNMIKYKNKDKMVGVFAIGGEEIPDAEAGADATNLGDLEAPADAKYMPYSAHRFCVMHMYSNFKQLHRGLPLKCLVWKAARATTVRAFESTMHEIKKRKLEAFTWLTKRPATNWSRAFFNTNVKSDVLLNNMCESFNAMILEARPKPIIDMLEHIRLILMKRTYVKRDMTKKWIGKVGPNIRKLLEANKEAGMKCKAHWNGLHEFEIESPDGQVTVNLERKECSYKKWQLSGIPCAHACCALIDRERDTEDLVDKCYLKSTYLQCYKHCMHTMHGPGDWPSSNLTPCF